MRSNKCISLVNGHVQKDTCFALIHYQSTHTSNIQHNIVMASNNVMLAQSCHVS